MRILMFCFITVLISCHSSRQNWSPTQKAQPIPGKVQCEFYDYGGEGIAYHDVDSINNGSGKLNPANGSYLNEFRMREGVDISYTKGKNIDTNPYNVTVPLMDQLYVGWTTPGEWFNCRVNVRQSGRYKIGFMYTANGNGKIGIQFADSDQKLTIDVPSTHNDSDTIAWRQWHHWSKLVNASEVILKKGDNTMKVEILANGNINLDYIEFVKED